MQEKKLVSITDIQQNAFFPFFFVGLKTINIDSFSGLKV
jgi:hypothetical protein